MKNQFKHFLKTAAISAGSLACSLLFAASAHAAQGDLVSVTLYDTNANGKMDRVDIAVDNSSLNTWTQNGTPAYAVKNGSAAAVTVSSVGFGGAPGANPVIFRLALDETDTDLSVDTSASALEVTYAQVGGGAACTNCFRDVTGSLEAPVIAAGDVGAAAEIDSAKPILTSVSPAVGATSTATAQAVVLNFSEPMTTTFAYGSGEGQMFTSSPNPGGWAATFSNSNKTVSLANAGFLKQTTYTITLVPANVTAASGLTPALDPAGTLVTLTSNHWSFTTSTGGTSSSGATVGVYTPPAYACALVAPAGGSTINASDTLSIGWTQSGADNELLSYSRDNKTWTAIDGLPNTATSYKWIVPSNIAAGQLWLKVDCREGGGGVLASATSGVMSVYSAATVAVPAPAPVETPAPAVVPAPVYVPAPTPSSGSGSVPAVVYARDLMLGSKGADVTTLQKFLVLKGLLRMPNGVAYGYFGGLTRDSLKQLQAGWRLPVTGKADATTRVQLNPKW